MTTAQPARTESQPPREAPRSSTGWLVAVGALVLGALILRLWGIRTGLPFVYNADENAHFVPRAIGMFDHSYNPGYFINPPAFTYLLHVAFAVRWGGDGVQDTYAADPGAVFAFARTFSALLGAVAAGLLAWAGARFFDRRTGLLAGALLAVAFLPVHYSHLALNDVPALAPMCLALVGVAGVVARGRGYALAGAGLGLAAATKYTAGIVLLCLIAAAVVSDRRPAARVRGMVVAGLAALATFVIANPYAVLDFDEFRDGLEKQSSAAAGEEGGKLGITQDSGLAYYLGSTTWGFGVLPVVAALGGAVGLAARRWRMAVVLVPAPILFLLFMGGQDRFFARWLLPVYPMLCLLAAWGALAGADWVAAKLRRREADTQPEPAPDEPPPALAPADPAPFAAEPAPDAREATTALAPGRALAARLRGRRSGPATALPALAVVALLAQGLVFSVHNDVVLAREDTRGLVRDWMVENIPEGSKVVVEPVFPDLWAMDPGRPSAKTGGGSRWIKWHTSRSQVNNDGTIRRGKGRIVKLEDYERTTRPQLVGSYARGGFCWVVIGSTQYGRAYAEPETVPNAIRYYDELRRRGRVVYRVSPYDEGADPVPFSFDDSFNYSPLAYHRPGPEIVVYRLRGCDR